jgi:hypothetical protein
MLLWTGFIVASIILNVIAGGSAMRQLPSAP